MNVLMFEIARYHGLSCQRQSVRSQFTLLFLRWIIEVQAHHEVLENYRDLTGRIW